MPRGDGTGPAGMGPMTGRAAGYCAGFNSPGSSNNFSRVPRNLGRANRLFARGQGRRLAGRGMGRGRRR